MKTQTDSLFSFSQSEKRYQQACLYPTLYVPYRAIKLTNGQEFFVYDTSGVYGDTSQKASTQYGLPDLRSLYLNARGDSEIKHSQEFSKGVYSKRATIRCAKSNRELTQMYNTPQFLDH